MEPTGLPSSASLAPKDDGGCSDYRAWLCESLNAHPLSAMAQVPRYRRAAAQLADALERGRRDSARPERGTAPVQTLPPLG